jgi:glycosidase
MSGPTSAGQRQYRHGVSGVQKSTWTRDKEAGAWFFHRFYDFQPDLNTSNPLVQAEILKIMGFWISSAYPASAWTRCRS